MFIRNHQPLKNVKISCLTLALLLNSSLHVQAKIPANLDEYKNSIRVQKTLSITTPYHPKLGIIEAHFDPRSNTESSLAQSTKHAFAGQDPKKVSDLAQAKKSGAHHANHVTSFIHQINPKAILRVIDIYNEPSVKMASGYNARLIAAIDAAIASKVDFINISRRIHPDENWNGAISKDLRKAFHKARDAGIGIIKSAGNDNEVIGSIIGSTAYTRSLVKLLDEMDGSMVLVVATTHSGTAQESLAPFSNKAGRAYKYTVAAPGTEIIAKGASNRLVTMSGTSMAAAFVTGRASLLKEQDPSCSSRDILAKILSSARATRKKNQPQNIYGQGICP